MKKVQNSWLAKTIEHPRTVDIVGGRPLSLGEIAVAAVAKYMAGESTAEQLRQLRADIDAELADIERATGVSRARYLAECLLQTY